MLQYLLALLLIAGVALTLQKLGVYPALAALLEPSPTPTARVGTKPALPALAAAVPTPTAAPDDTLPQVQGSGGVTADLTALLRQGWDYPLTGEGVEILILHSHTSECYRDAAAGQNGRSSDPAENVTAVGAALAEALTARGWGVYHETAVFDSPRYSGAYERSGAQAAALLDEYPGIRVVIDLHRDALNGKTTAVTVDGVSCAQVMLLLTTGADGLYHPGYRENLKLGLRLQQDMERRFPGLSRPLYLSSARYNQHLCPGSLLLEVGSDADTLSQAMEAAKRFADTLDAVLREGRG